MTPLTRSDSDAIFWNIYNKISLQMPFFFLGSHCQTVSESSFSNGLLSHSFLCGQSRKSSLLPSTPLHFVPYILNYLKKKDTVSSKTYEVFKNSLENSGKDSQL